MKLLTKTDARRLPKLYSTEDLPAERKIAFVKFFNSRGRGTWYAVEGEECCEQCGMPPSGHDEEKCPMYMMDVRFFGFVVSPLGPDCDEWGYFHLSELSSAGLERDMHWRARPIPEVQDTGGDL